MLGKILVDKIENLRFLRKRIWSLIKIKVLRQCSQDVLVKIEISSEALKANFKELQRLAPEWGVAPVLKSNAYGHGLFIMANWLIREKLVTPFWCVDSYFEAEKLRLHGINERILILGATFGNKIKHNQWDKIDYSVGEWELLREIGDLGRTVSVQIKLDSGMNRQGFRAEMIGMLIRYLLDHPKIIVTGIFSHLAESEIINSDLTWVQIKTWNRLVVQFRETFKTLKYWHLANSHGFLLADKVIANVGRAGIGLYGYSEDNSLINLKPALKMFAKIVGIKPLLAGEKLGYGGSFSALTDRRVGLIPVGYYEGIDKRLSNQGVVMINGTRAPILGRVSMNMISVDLTNVEGVKVGDLALVLGGVGETAITKMAHDCQTIPYEILVHLPSHLRRQLV